MFINCLEITIVCLNKLTGVKCTNSLLTTPTRTHKHTLIKPNDK